jgi:ribosomal protein L19
MPIVFNFSATKSAHFFTSLSLTRFVETEGMETSFEIHQNVMRHIQVLEHGNQT